MDSTEKTTKKTQWQYDKNINTCINMYIQGIIKRDTVDSIKKSDSQE